MALPQWQYLHGAPLEHGVLKQQPSDFCVTEELGYEADGQGEHLFIEVEKTGLNTAAVAKMIAIWANVMVRDVSYAGLKDRHGITRQTFSVQLPGKESPPLEALSTDQLTIISAKRNSKKLRRGALKGNQFSIFVRKLSSSDALINRLEVIAKQGVPNYFGPQRFGHDGSNIEHALALFGGQKVKNRDKRSIYLSAARSLLFNQVVSERIASNKHEQPMLGDAFILNGSKAGFTPESLDNEIMTRFFEQDIVLSAPMFGKGDKIHSDAADFESGILGGYAEVCKGLISHGLKHERRALLLLPRDMTWQFEPEGVRLSFNLPSGCYATSVLRELAIIDDVSSEMYKRDGE